MLGVHVIDTRASSSYTLRTVRPASSSINKFRFLSCAGLLSWNIERDDVYQSRGKKSELFNKDVRDFWLESTTFM